MLSVLSLFHQRCDLLLIHEEQYFKSLYYFAVVNFFCVMISDIFFFFLLLGTRFLFCNIVSSVGYAIYTCNASHLTSFYPTAVSLCSFATASGRVHSEIVVSPKAGAVKIDSHCVNSGVGKNIALHASLADTE